MNEKPFHPEEDSKVPGAPEEPSILDYLIQSLRQFPKSLNSRNKPASASQTDTPAPKADVSQVDSSDASAQVLPLSEQESMVQSDSNRRSQMMVKLPFGAFVIFGVEKDVAKNASPGQADSLKTRRSPRLPVIHFKAKREFTSLNIICSLLFSLTGLWLIFQAVPGPLRWVEWLLLFNGVLIYIFATRVGEEAKESLWEYLTGGKLEFGVKGWQKICLAVSVCLAFVAAASAGYELLMKHPYLSVLAWLGAIILAIVGGWRNNTTQRGLDKWDIILFLTFTVAAFAIRAVNVSHNPQVLTGDEASSGLSALNFIQGKMNNIFTIGWYSFPSFFNFLQSLSIRLFGQTTEALRLLSVLAGALTVGAVYLFGSRMFNRWSGVFSALFLLAFHYHNHFSRIGLNNIWDGLWFVVVLGLFWYGWEKEDRLSFLFCGLSLGLAQYFYVSSRTLLFLVPLIILILAFVDRKQANKWLGNIVLMALVCLVVILPMMFFFIQHPVEYNAPFQRATIFADNWMAIKTQQTGLSPLMIVLDQIRLSFAGLFNVPLRGPFYEPTTPLLRPVSAFLFLLGLLFLLLKLRVNRAYILFLWIGIIVLIGGLSDNTPYSTRYIAIAPVLALTIGFGMAELGKFLGKARPRFTFWIFTALLTIFIVFGADELRFYYIDYAPQAVLGGDNALVAQRLAEYVRTKDSSWQVAFFGSPRMEYYSYSTLPYLAPSITGVNLNAPWGSPDNPPVTGDHTIFVFLPNHTDDLKAVQAAYPNGRLQEEKYKGNTLYWLYEVPSS